MPFSHLRQKPFNLDDAAISWVRNTLNSLSIDERIAQTFTLLSRGGTEADLTELATLQPGGITRFFTGTAQTEAAFIAAYAKAAKAPPLISADLEGSRMSLPFGTQVLNPLGLAAVNDAPPPVKSAALWLKKLSPSALIGRLPPLSTSITPGAAPSSAQGALARILPPSKRRQ